MLPSLVQFAYRIYKEDTDKVATWLAVQGRLCGYEGDIPGFSSKPAESAGPTASKGRLKGKARKEAKADKEGLSSTDNPNVDKAARPTYTLRVRDFTALAKKITASTKPVVRVPSNIVNALNRAIELRQKYSTDYSTADEDADQGHQHFLSVLEQTRDILRPKFDLQSIKKQKAESSSATSSRDESVTAAEFLKNKFEALDVEEPSESFQSALGVKPKASKQQQPSPRYQVEAGDDEAERELAANILMQDVSKIRKLIRGVWTDYQKGLDLVAASLTTNVAIQTIKNLELDYSERFPETEFLTYRLSREYLAACARRGEDPLLAEPGCVNPVCYDLADSTMSQGHVVLRKLIDSLGPENCPPYWKPDPIPERDTSRPRRTKTAKERTRDDRAVFSSVFGNMIIVGQLLTRETAWTADELCLELATVEAGDYLRLHMIFAAQCFLDIHHILDTDLDKPFAELQQWTKIIWNSLSPALDANNSLAWPLQGELKAALKHFLSNLKNWILEDNFQQDTTEAFPLDKGKGKDELHASNLECHRLFKNHPVLCGIFLFRVKWEFQKWSLKLVNMTLAVISAAHLYNCLREEGLLQSTWKDMEAALMLQDRHRLLLSNNARRKDYHNHILLAGGMSLTNLARDSRTMNTKMSGKRRELESNFPLSDVLGSMSREAASETLWTEENLYRILERHGGAEMPGTTPASDRKRQKAKEEASPPRRSPVSIDEALKMLAERLHEEKLQLGVNYLQLHHRCWEFLSKLRVMCHDELREANGERIIENEDMLPFVAAFLLKLYGRTPEKGRSRPGEQEEQNVHPRLLDAVSAVEELISDGQGSVMCEDMEARGLKVEIQSDIT